MIFCGLTIVLCQKLYQYFLEQMYCYGVMCVTFCEYNKADVFQFSQCLSCVTVITNEWMDGCLQNIPMKRLCSDLNYEAIVHCEINNNQTLGLSSALLFARYFACCPVIEF